MARPDLRLLLLLALVLGIAIHPSDASASSRHPHHHGQFPKPVHLSFPPWTAAMNCSYNSEVGLTDNFVCTRTTTNPSTVVFSNDNEVTSVRFQYKTPVQLYKKGTRLAASFSTFFVVDVDKDVENNGPQTLFGGGIAFAITPDQAVRTSGAESIGLFPIDTATGNPLGGADPRTVAVELDTSREFMAWDAPSIPHIGLDVNSLKSVAYKTLGTPAAFTGRKIGVWVEYDAVKETLVVLYHKTKLSQTPNRKKATVVINYSPFRLSKYVNEESFVGFSTRVPITTNGVYILYNWKFDTQWVKTNNLQG